MLQGSVPAVPAKAGPSGVEMSLDFRLRGDDGNGYLINPSAFSASCTFGRADTRA